FSPDGKTLAASTLNQGTRSWRLQLYAVETGEVVRELGNGDAALGLGRTFVAFLSGGAPGGLAFSPDGKVVAEPEGNAVRCWATDAGGEATGAGGHRGAVAALVLPPGGKLVATQGADNTVRLWDAVTGEQRHRFAAPGGAVCVAVAPDARTV